MTFFLILRPLEWFGIVVAELKREAPSGRLATVGAAAVEAVAAATLGDATDSAADSAQEDARWADVRALAVLCDELRPDSLYARYANRQVFRHASDFWATKEKTVQTYVKRMADRKLGKAIALADRLGIPIHDADDLKTPLRVTPHIATPIMNFCRHDDGTTYWLHLRIGGNLVDDLSRHHPLVLAYEPGLFVLDQCIYSLCEGFSGQLLLPFVGKQRVEIPRRVENDYFRRFIFKQVARAEVHADGFDISDVCMEPQACLKADTFIDGSHMLSLYFRYGQLEYAAESESNGRVTLTEEQDGFRFVRQVRDKKRERQSAETLAALTGTPGPYVRFASLSLMVDWLRAYAPGLRAHGFDVVQPSDHIYYIGPLSVEQSDTWHGDWLQTDVTVVVERPNSPDDQTPNSPNDQTPNSPNDQLRIPFLDLRDTILRGEREYMLPTGEILLIPAEWLKRYSDLLLIGMPKGNGFQRHRSQISVGEELRAEGQEVSSWHPEGENLPHPAAISASGMAAANSSLFTLPSSLKATLRPYQLTGFQWLWRNFVAQTGCCLSDEMGLGKTLQTIALLAKYKEAARPAPAVGRPAPGMLFSDDEMRGDSEGRAVDGETFPMPYRTSLVVAPASVVHNWRNELARFAPSLLVMTYTGDVAKRKDKRLALMRWDVVVTTYRTLLNDISLLSRHEFGIVVFDESQAFKTATSLIHQAVAELRALHRMALSGTPVENNLQELWSLMNVLNPCLLGDAQSFRQSFAAPIAAQMEDSRRQLLRRLIAPYFLKRTKEEVLADLPERQDEVVVCTMTDEQTRQYAEELSKARNEWLDPAASLQGRQIHILAALQRLRQIANGQGKLKVVFDHLENLRPTRHKVLLFSEYVSLLEQVADEMTRRGWGYALLTGQTHDREQVIARFQSAEPADCQFFLISLKAGGVGLNLTAADYVFLLDPWWNRAAEEQAIARAHRIGQRRSVFVYRFVSASTLEEQILTLQDRKQSLIDSVMPFIL